MLLYPAFESPRRLTLGVGLVYVFMALDQSVGPPWNLGGRWYCIVWWLVFQRLGQRRWPYWAISSTTLWPFWKPLKYISIPINSNCWGFSCSPGELGPGLICVWHEQGTIATVHARCAVLSISHTELCWAVLHRAGFREMVQRHCTHCWRRQSVQDAWRRHSTIVFASKKTSWTRIK